MTDTGEMHETYIYKKEGEKVSESYIRNFERKEKFQFPGQFADFYMLHNGGIPKEYIYNDGNRILTVNHFLPFQHGVYEDMAIEEVYHTLLEEEVIPIGYVPFAMEESGDYFVISIKEDEHGCICLWSHETAGMKKVNDSFESFIECLTDQIPHEN